MCEVWNGNRYPDVFDVKLAVSRLVEHDDRYQDRSLDQPRVKGTYLSAISTFISVGQIYFLNCEKLENAAKFRAVEQHVGTYDEFKAIVDGCHLKPLDRKEEIDSILKPNEHKWNNVAPTDNIETPATKPSNQADPNNLNQNLNLEKIQIYGDFERLWPSLKNKWVIRNKKCQGELSTNQ